ncbi:MAG: hypothetical protein KDA93_02290 [Planctomycetaceae bacterium]|nr:hypothetical protein [Planctomycetaceae bacterium]
MNSPIILPDLGEGDQPIRLAQWLVESGDTVVEGDRVVEVLVGGVLFHVASPTDGVVRRTIESEGTLLVPGTELGLIVQESR